MRFPVKVKTTILPLPPRLMTPQNLTLPPSQTYYHRHPSEILIFVTITLQFVLALASLPILLHILSLNHLA
jgi:hypothetical protein